MNPRWNQRVKYGTYALELFVLFFLQNLFYVPIFGERPVLLLAALVTIALLEPETPALYLGLMGGLLLDFAAGGALGLTAMSTTVLCCLVSVLIKKKKHVTMLTAMGTAAWALAALFVMDWLVRCVLPGVSLPLVALINNYVPRYLYTLLLVPLLYLLNLGLFVGFRPAAEWEKEG